MFEDSPEQTNHLSDVNKIYFSLFHEHKQNLD